ncbi:hypothetical protein [Bordetella genomosp. 13]|uniref:Uncharacterized protein n=1 Tax=Bordetella genomosp. 13 TaxID=463040 RepID=A0A1W6ZBJ2_9BORD|nr:hypothetical protein [Bordetella genomosp. 13]ARP94622.1 hypothetical protein CAL15_09615 [Bordetella genomosp. 13]
MALPGEPKNGDFASYVESLSRNGGPAPGQVLQPVPREQRPREPAPKPAARSAAAAAAKPSGGPDASGWGRSDKPAPAATATPLPAPARGTPGGFADGSPAAQQLARVSSHRRVALILTLAAVALCWSAFATVIEAMNRQPRQVEDFFPAVFLTFVALMLFKAASRLRAKAREGVLPKYGPLETLTRRPDRQG